MAICNNGSNRIYDCWENLNDNCINKFLFVNRKKLIVGPTASKILEMSKHVFIDNSHSLIVIIGHVNSYFSVHCPFFIKMHGKLVMWNCYVNISVANTCIFLKRERWQVSIQSGNKKVSINLQIHFSSHLQ